MRELRAENGRYCGAAPELVAAAKELRNRPTDAETVLWQAIRRRQIGGARLRRQHPLGGFVLGFCCPEHRLVIEVDGPVHDDQRECDEGRTEHLETHGFRILRFRNDEVFGNLASVRSRIETALAERSARLPLPPERSGGRGPGG